MIFFAKDPLSSDEMRHAEMKMSYLNMKITDILSSQKSAYLFLCVLDLKPKDILWCRLNLLVTVIVCSSGPDSDSEFL